MFKKEKRKFLLFLIVIIFLIVVFGIAIRYIENSIPEEEMRNEFLTEETLEKWQEEEREIVGTVKLNGKKFNYYDEIQTYLFIGTDNNSMADFLLLLVANKTDDTYGFIQLDRDTMTEVRLLAEDGTGESCADIQLCTAHWYGGSDEIRCENTVEAVSKLLGDVRIDGYYSLDMEEIATINEALGGVSVKLEEDFTYIHKKMKKGVEWTLSDEQAYAYIHDRYGVGDETNQSRMNRQRQYMKNAMLKVKEQSKEDANYIVSLYQKMEEKAVTTIKGKCISQMAKLMSGGSSKGIYCPEGKTKVGQALGDGISHVEFYPKKDSILQIMTELYDLEE